MFAVLFMPKVTFINYIQYIQYIGCKEDLKTMRQEIKAQEIELKTGVLYTIFNMDSFMALTHRKEVIITGVLNDRYTFKLKGKRKEFYLDLDECTAVFEGLTPFKADSEFDSFRGNACINIVGDLETIKEYFETRQLNPYFEKWRVLIVGEDTKTPERVLYPEIAQEQHHAVIERILSRQ